MKQTFQQRLITVLAIVLAVLTAAFLCALIFLSRAGGMTQNELLKLQTPVMNRSLAFQKELHSLRINTENALPSVTAALEKTKDLPVDQQQAALLPVLMPLLENSEASGMFVIFGGLDAPTESRELVYLRDARPSVGDPAYGDLMFRGGNAAVAKEYKIPLDSTWWQTLPIEKETGEFYTNPLIAVQESGDPLSCGYFSSVFRLSPKDRNLMTFSLPIVTSSGHTLGVFGIELSGSQLGELLPSAEIPFSTGVYLFGSFKDGGLDVKNAILSGGYRDVLLNSANKEILLGQSSFQKNFFELHFGNGEVMLGTAAPISLYESGDYYFSENDRQLVGMVRESSFYVAINRVRHAVYPTLLILMLTSAGCLIVLTRRVRTSVDAFTGELKRLHEQQGYTPSKTNLIDLDEIIELFSTPPPQAVMGELPPDLFQEFIDSTKTLTESERRVFDLYIAGNTLKEIAEQTCTSVNTIKKHTQHIYEKLNISSREELLLYILLIRKSSMMEKLS